MPIPYNLQNLVDLTVGNESLVEVARRKGVFIGAATGGTTRLASSEYMQFCIKNSSIMNTLSGFYPWNFHDPFGSFNFTLVDSLLNLAGDIPVMGSFAFYFQWPNGSSSTYWMNQMTSENWRDRCEAHIIGLTAHAQRMGVILVSNEHTNDNGDDWRDMKFNNVAGDGFSFLSFVFSKCREHWGPNVKLFYCETQAEADSFTLKRSWLLNQIIDPLLSLNYLGQKIIDGIAFQGHLSTTYPFTTGIPFRKLIQDIKQRSLEIRITEFDYKNGNINNDDEFLARAANDVGRFMTICLEEGVKHFTFWDIRNDWTWLDDPNKPNDFNQLPLPYLENGRPSQIERAIRATLI